MSKKNNNKPTTKTRIYQIIMAIMAMVMIISMIAAAVRF